MIKEDLFKLIRQEDVILWAGAGMSMYAGYPSGNGLRDILYLELPVDRQTQISPHESLQIMSRFFVNVNGGDRTKLSALLQRIFEKHPSAINVHKELTLVSHIKTIITTNYDKLFEMAYEGNANVIYESSQLRSIEKNLITIFKAHGDLQDLNSLIITDSDYTKFFQEDYQNNSLWTTIKERLINNSVLFIGYGLEDINTNAILGKIFGELADNRKPHFFVAPGLVDVRIEDLKRQNIDYIDATAEEIIDGILNDLKENVLTKHISEGEGSATTVAKFVDQFGIGTTREVNQGQDRLVEVFPKVNVLGSLKVTAVKESAAERSLRDFFGNNDIGPIVVSNNEHTNLTLSFSGVRMPSENFELEFSNTPNFDETVLVRFKDGFEYSDIKAKAFRTVQYIEIQADFAVARLTFRLYPNSLNAQGIKSDLIFEHNPTCGSVSEEISFFKFLNKLVTGKKFDIFTSKRLINSASHNVNGSLKQEFSFCQQFFENLKKIEQRSQLVFTNISFAGVNDDTHLIISYVLAMQQNRQIKHTWRRGYEFATDVADKIEAMQFAKGKTLENNLKLFGNFEENVKIFGYDFTLGYPVYQILQPKFTRDFIREQQGMVMLISEVSQRVVYFTSIFSGPVDTPSNQISIAVLQEQQFKKL